VWGEVVDADGAGVPRAAVLVSGEPWPTHADDSGVFGVRVAPGRLTVSAGAASAIVEVAEGGDAHVRLVVPTR
jgi:hypothetical protein